MKILESILKKIEEFDRENDDVVENAVYHEYFFEMRLSLFYPKLKSYYILIHLVQFIIYFYTLSSMMLTLIVSAVLADDLLLMINSLHLAFLMGLFLVFIFLANFKRQSFALTHKLIGIGVYSYNEKPSNTEIVMRRKYLKILKYLKIILPFTNLIAGVNLVIVGPWIDNLTDDRIYTEQGLNLKLPFTNWYPFESHEGIGFWYAILSQSLSVAIISLGLTSSSWFYFTTTIHVIIQLERLILSVKHIERRATSMYNSKLKCSDKVSKFNDPKFINCMEFCLNQSLQHHIEILRLQKHEINTMKGPLFATLFAGGIILALSAFIVVTISGRPGTLLAILSIAASEIAHITAICKGGQHIIDLHQQLHYEFFAMPWYKCSKKFRTSLLIAQLRTSRKFEHRTIFGFTADMVTYNNILNTAYSYLSILLAFKR